MTVPVLAAITDRRAEARIVQAFESGILGVHVVRRCADLADVLATAAAGTARAAVISHDLRRLDRDALARLATLRVAVIVLVPVDDEDAERRIRQLGVTDLLPVDAEADEIAALVLQAISGGSDGTSAGGLSDVSAAFPMLPEPDDFDTAAAVGDGVGRVIAVWGPTGAPGRTTVAATLAAEFAAAGESTLLIDADVYGGAVAQALGLLDEAPGLAAAARAANNGSLDVPALAELARAVGPRLRVLTGIARAERWPELRPAAIENVLDVARRLVKHTVIDCSFCLEE
ncbi:MAG: P-loop NTPase, partial [Mycobacteriales bacterium]